MREPLLGLDHAAADAMLKLAIIIYGGSVQEWNRLSEEDRVHYLDRAKAHAEFKAVRAAETPTHKETNPKDALGSSRAPMHLNPAEALVEMSVALAEGAGKYGAHNYALMGARASIYCAAAERHLKKFELGRDRDPVSSVHELAYCMACCAILIATQRRGTLVDDRGPALPSEEIDRLFAEAEARIKHLSETFTLAEGAKHWSIDDTSEVAFANNGTQR